MLWLKPGAAEAEHWNMLTSGGGRTPPILKPTRSHSEGRWTIETNDTSATNETSGHSVTRPLMEETMCSTLYSPKHAVKAMTIAIERAGENQEKENAGFWVEVREEKDAQIQYIDRVVDIPECAEDGDSPRHVRLVCVLEACDELSSME